MFFRKKEENLRRFAVVSEETWLASKPEGVDELEWVALYSYIKRPERATMGSAGYDFFATFGFTLAPGESILIPTGIKSYMNIDDELKVYPRSSLGFKYQMQIANTVAKIDSDYVDNPKNEGHIFIKVVNRGNKELTIERQEAFCQGSFYKYLTTVDDNATARRVGGIGSTNERR